MKRSAKRSTPDRFEIPRRLLISLLAKRGWLAAEISAEAHKASSGQLRRVVRRYQRFHGLKIDGWAGPVTQRSLETPRFCAHPDRMSRGRQTCKWPQIDVTWAVTGRLPGISAADQKDAFALAWRFWSEICGLSPEYSGNPRTANVLMGVGAIDSSGKTLAWSELPCGVGSSAQLNQKYDSSEPWVIAEHPEPHRIDPRTRSDMPSAFPISAAAT